MSFNVYFSDPTKAATPIVVEDGKPGNPGNTVDTTLTLLGKNASGYANAIATNFVQLLENFASPDAPTNPIEGQIWYDNENKRLKINDSTAGGANWKPVNGIYQQSSEPSTAQAGDIWVNTDKNQVFMTSDGATWTLVGPSFSSSLKSGPNAEVIFDKFGQPHTVIKNYINDVPVEIISLESFTPQQIISGFSSIEQGLNLNSGYSTKLNASSLVAERLLVTTPYTETVLGNNFVRNDINGTIKASLTVRDSLQVGAEPTFVFQKAGLYTNEFINSYNNGAFSFKISKNSILTEILKITGDTKRVGINVGDTTNPQADLHVKGDTILQGNLSVTTGTGVSLTVFGPSTIYSSLRVTGTSTFVSSSAHQSIVTLGKESGDSADTTIMKPAVSDQYNIGSSSSKFRNIYASTFRGTLLGDVIGNASGLSNTSSWSLSGQFSGTLKRGGANTLYRGEAGDYKLEGSLNRFAISSQTSVTEVYESDEIIVGTPTRNNGISKATKYAFLSELYASVVPPGTVLPWAGPNPLGIGGDYGNIPNNVKVQTLQSTIYNWLVCDGAYVNKLDYRELYLAIGYSYGKSSDGSKFRLPDLRGRLPLGFDNMSNGFDNNSPTNPAGVVPAALQPNKSDLFNGTDQSVFSGGSSSSGGVKGGSRQPTLTTDSSGLAGVWDNTTTQISSVMNPYFAFNYIIKT